MIDAGTGRLKLPEGARYSFTLSATNEDGKLLARSQAPFKLVYPLSAEEFKQHADTPFGLVQVGCLRCWRGKPWLRRWTPSSAP